MIDFDWLRTHWVAVVLMLLYTGVLMHHAQVGRRASRGLGDYYVGGRAMGGAVIGVSFFATFASTNSYIGHAGKGYQYGLPWLLMAALIVAFTALSWVLVAPRLRRFTAHWDALTLPDYLERRFVARGPALRATAGVVILLSSVLYLVAIFKGAGNLFEVFLGIRYETAVGVALVIVVLYTSIGGFVSVVRTDVLQGILMVLGSLTIFWFVTDAAGGVTRIVELAERPQTAGLFSWGAGVPFVVLLGIALSGSLKLLVDPRQVSRFYALRDARSVSVGLWVAVIGIALIQFCLFPIGLYAHFLLDGVTDTDLIMPTLVSDPTVFPVWVGDFLVIAIIAAAMSSMDSVLLVGASVLYRDLVEPVRPAARPLVWSRAGVIALAVVSAWIALRPPGGIVEITIFSGSLYAVCFLPAILFGLHWRRGNAVAVLASMAAGVSVLLGWMLSGAGAQVHEVFPALAVSCLVYTAVSLGTRPALERWPEG
ncbi:MAG: sodium/solute symporter [Pseudomonadales bacterium]|nr:sodium/solute symporter [Pseudomonadales bacterium]